MEKNGQNQALCGHPLPWSQGLDTQASPPGHGGHTWRRYPFIQHGKEVGWRIQTWQGEPRRRPSSRKMYNVRFCPFFHFQGLEG